MDVIDPPPPAPQPPAPSPLGRLRLALWALVLIAAFGGGALYFASRQKPPGAADAYASAYGGSFAMTNQAGRTVTDKSLHGRPYAIFFGFTRCPDVCPTTLNRMAQLRKKLGADGDKFDIVFVSVDPEHDKREDIGRYVELFGTPIIGLTGTDAQIERIVKAFRIYYAKVPIEGGDYTIDHTASIFLIDREGSFVTTIDHQEGDDVAAEKLKRAITQA
ncbi:SCO family protein [Sphingomonas colocasiae]|uniref:SCO family protein n=1 Tax=Sphingomonas colocasiae TaxID=1848973 RepID=A0ABS7PUG5_9SPHN|nr:SCO family protein [Sphingomonas colocasiae]MBY8824992.1 SCO family protein [Sphingomonas colocasiae]